MKTNQRKNQHNDFFENLPQAFSNITKTIIPIFSDGKNTVYTNERPPLRAELFTNEQLEQHARNLARKHKISAEEPSEQLLKRLADNEDILMQVHSLLTESVKNSERIPPAGEWLLDNFYLIEEQIYTGKKHLPKGYSKGLPQLSKGESSGLPRVYDIAVEIISHSDGHVDLGNLVSFVNAYQEHTYLQLGELWAIPIMLRLALIENLRRLSIQISNDMGHKALANNWADEMINVSQTDSKNLILVIADMARSEPPMESAFIAELIRRLQEQGSSLTLALSWIEQTLTDNGFNSNELIHQETQKQAADQVSISNSISSLRFLSTTDWREFVETTSIVEEILRKDIGGTYGRMDFYTRDTYRHAVEKMAKYSDYSEKEIAEMAIQFAAENAESGKDGKLAHVGYFLAGRGLFKMEKTTRMKSGKVDSLKKLFNKLPFGIYAGTVLAITAAITYLLLKNAWRDEHGNTVFILLAIATALAASRLALALINWVSTLVARPALLPRMNFSLGIPPEYRTMVVVPTLLTSDQGTADLIENLEVRFLANRDSNLSFALLTDFADADQEHLPGDDALVAFARNKITELNEKYERQSNDTFFLFHRPRKWNRTEKKWMGYERKRGKLSDLNALILGHGVADHFSEIVADEAAYRGTKFIITLDTDTQLPRDAAWKMVGTLAHPLNHAVYNPKKKRVTEGYTILQPRVSNSLPGKNSSIYARMHGNEPGTDPYTRATSDVYQDLFKEGSFIGKGIYDIKAFEATLHQCFPDNAILSHDLLEGCYTRSGLITDVQLYEEYPNRYQSDIQRRHRWIRGDWQIGNWILPFVPGAKKKIVKNPLTILARWKIFDNIRRSLVPLALMLLLLFGWGLSATPIFWTAGVLLIIFLPGVINLVWSLVVRPPDLIFKQHARFTIESVSNQFFQHLVELATLPYETFKNMDAIGRTLWRMFISHRHLLQWNPYHSTINSHTSISDNYRAMWFGPFLSVVIFGYLTVYAPLTVAFAMPFLILWTIAPFLTWAISRPYSVKTETLSASQEISLRVLSRKIWYYFETFVTAEENWLPPDNYQEAPVEAIAHRTSPTNIGLCLLSYITAHDFGFIGVEETIERSSRTLDTLMRMDRYRGHLYNWYDTQSITPLYPRYISTVDSGNLVGHLVTLQQSLLLLADEKVYSSQSFMAIGDAVRILMEKTSESKAIKQFLNSLEERYPAAVDDLYATWKLLEELENEFAELMMRVDFEPDQEDDIWAEKVQTQISNFKAELEGFYPWLQQEFVPEKFAILVPTLKDVSTPRALSKIEESLFQSIVGAYAAKNTPAETEWLNTFRAGITEAGRRGKQILLGIDRLAHRCRELSDVDYDFLYDRQQHLLAIGYNVEEHRLDNSFYDLLASEARLTTFIAIAQGKLPQDSWFALGRQLTSASGTPVLLSWSGSMFEYLMPLLVMPSYDNTLLEQTYRGVVQRQIDYGRKRAVPWGISESGYNMVDAHLNYQYKAFGVPGLGFKRGLGDDLVIAPYATLMSLMVNVQEAFSNMETMREAGFEGRYGFFEAIDYTPARLLRRQNFAVVKSFMAHHQGMSFLSLSHALLDKPMHRRFESNVEVKSTLLLLQERIPRISNFYRPTIAATEMSSNAGTDTSMRVIPTPNTAVPEVQLLSNGRYNVMVTNAGGGYSRWKNLALTRWREDATCDNWGTFCYIRDLDTDAYWSSAFQPTLHESSTYEAVFSQGRAEFRRRDFAIETHTEIVVSPEDDIELRRLHITNRSRKKRTIEITSYAEVVLAPPAADESHPAFSNLFVQTQINHPRHAILCTRRPRSVEEETPWMFHLMKAHEAEIVSISYETNRSRFIGRGNSINSPAALRQKGPLSGSEGSVLDPIISIQYRIVLEPMQSAIVDLIVGVAETKEVCNNLIDKYQDRNITNRVLELAWTHSQVNLRQINAVEADAQLYSRLAASIIFSNKSLRTDPATILKNQRGQSGLWGYSISGDLPIVLLQIGDAANIDLVKQMVQAHTYWRMKGLMVDLIIWNEDHGGYRQVLHNNIQSLVAPGFSSDSKEHPGGIFVRAADQISNEDRILFQTVAHIIISDELGTLEEQMNRRSKPKSNIPYFTPSRFHTSVFTSIPAADDLVFYNGIGGYSADGKEYVINTTPGQVTPAPWVNVIANPNFGTVISESGQSYTWVENAHGERLTPWNNDTVGDLKGEAFYLRDEESGRFWSPAPLPARGLSRYVTRHGFGYSVFEHSEDGIRSEMTVYVDLEEPVKFFAIKIHNHSNRARKISLTGFVEWVLGDLKAKNMMHTITEVDVKSGAIMARNAYNVSFRERVAFFDVDETVRTITCDRTEFIGRNGTMANPDAMIRSRLSGKSGAGLDPCGAIQILVDLVEDQEKEIVFRLGAGLDADDAMRINNRFGGKMAAHNALTQVKDYWNNTLGAVRIQTPDTALNLLSNGWLNYQTIACRIWARSGFYQSGGAFGFRDQLQDVMSLVHVDPQLYRKQLLLSASRQFIQGDVQHWWHPPEGRGVRTTCSDDYLWLPFATCRYVQATGDSAVLDEEVHFIEGRLLNSGEDSYYDLPIVSDRKASLYSHCVKAIEHALVFGAHGLPLIGSGDWNDGMDKVGNHGKGESVWLAFFLYDILIKFAEIAVLKVDPAFATTCLVQASQLKQNIETNTWDGEWYRRAYFDDGTPLGSQVNDECRIDSIAQSWSVLSGAGKEDRVVTAMKSANKFLVRKDDGLIQLFNPPFDKSQLNPGYIKGYVPGVRENGGQYTHAAIWLVMAFAALGNKKKTWDLLSMINPVNKGNSVEKISIYKTEPYVVAADVYAEPLHKGRGGWTWYTGSAGWMYQLILEYFIGLKRQANKIHFEPCLPEDWPSVKLSYSAEGKWYEIELLQDTATAGFSLIVNGVQQEGLAFELEEALVLEIPEEPKKLTN